MKKLQKVVENYTDGIFAEFKKNYGCDCGITVCGQYDENNKGSDNVKQKMNPCGPLCILLSSKAGKKG